jgi:hypothetical protein
LGAGLDTFALRNPFADLGARVFEVDYAATQAWKREWIKAAGLTEPRSLIFAPIDFERERLSEGLTRAGFRLKQPISFGPINRSSIISPLSETNCSRQRGARMRQATSEHTQPTSPAALAMSASRGPPSATPVMSALTHIGHWVAACGGDCSPVLTRRLCATC